MANSGDSGNLPKMPGTALNVLEYYMQWKQASTGGVVRKMSEVGLSGRIVRKIKDGNMDSTVKEFLLGVLGQELEHSNEAMWRYGQVYEHEIRKGIGKRD